MTTPSMMETLRLMGSIPDDRKGTVGPVPPRSQFDPLAARFGPRQDPNPDPMDLLRELHRAVYGGTWARPDSPAKVWRELIEKVHERFNTNISDSDWKRLEALADTIVQRLLPGRRYGGGAG